MVSVNYEQTAKQVVRGNTRPGANSYWTNVDKVVNAGYTSWSLYRLVVNSIDVNHINIESDWNSIVVDSDAIQTGATVKTLQNAMLAALPTGVYAEVVGSPSSYLEHTSTDIIFTTDAPNIDTYPWYVSSCVNGAPDVVNGDTLTFSGYGYVNGAPKVGDFISSATFNQTFFEPNLPKVVSVTSGTNLVVTITSGFGGNFAVGSGTFFSGAALVNVNLAEISESTPYPNYVGSPYAKPTWVDDATVHAYQVIGGPGGSIETPLVNQYQVRQIGTNVQETQIQDGYFAQYQSNLDQTKQRNTKNQQC